jgi:hypothetical protein
VTPDSITVTFDGTQLEALPYGRLLYHPASGTAVDEIPAELSARWTRCGLLAQQGQTAPLRTEALELRELLLDGRWKITRPVFERHFEAASTWAGAGEPPANYRLALSEAVDRLWSSGADTGLKPWTTGVATTGVATPPPRRSTITAGGVQFTVLTQTLGGRTSALIAGPSYVEREWKSRIAALEERHRVRMALQDVSARGAASGISRRIAADTGLPWTVTVQSEGQSPNGFLSRRKMWIGALAILACLVLTGSYVAGRAVSRGMRYEG